MECCYLTSMTHSPHNAGLRDEECTSAVAAGASLMLSAKTHVKISQLQVAFVSALLLAWDPMQHAPDYGVKSAHRRSHPWGDARPLMRQPMAMVAERPLLCCF